eukprot:364570-Chlamydomonas_euryale.AAC.24
MKDALCEKCFKAEHGPRIRRSPKLISSPPPYTLYTATPRSDWKKVRVGASGRLQRWAWAVTRRGRTTVRRNSPVAPHLEPFKKASERRAAQSDSSIRRCLSPRFPSYAHEPLPACPLSP